MSESKTAVSASNAEKRRLAKVSQKKAEAQKAALLRAKELNIDDEKLLKIAQLLRDTSKMLAVRDGATYGKRIEFFSGETLVDALTSPPFEKKKLLPRKITRLEAVAIGDMLVAGRYIHRSELTNKEELAKAKFDDVLAKLIPHPTLRGMEDEEEAYYTWVFDKSFRKLQIKSAIFVLLLLSFAAIKAWPLWLKILVWWISNTLLIMIITLLIARLAFAFGAWLIGFRGLWLLPNIMYDELDFMDAIVPLVGYGIYSQRGKKEEKKRQEKKEKELAEKRRLKRILKAQELGLTAEEAEAAENGDEGDEKGEKGEKGEKKAAGAKEEKVEEKEKDADEGCSRDNCGLINLGIIVILALLVTERLGLFLPENIPDFVISQSDLYKHYPSLGSPPAENATATDAPKVEPEGGVKLDHMGNPVEEINEDDIAGMGQAEEETDETGEEVAQDSSLDEQGDVEDIDS